MLVSNYQFAYSIYQRQFRQPLYTSHGKWEVRVGIIIHLTDDLGRSHQGEIAPIPWFGSESIDRASEWCRSIGDRITTAQIALIPDTLPACQFAVGSAISAVNEEISIDRSHLKISALLPTGAGAIDAWQGLWLQGYTTFKWKIGVAPIAQEVAIWEQLMMALPLDAQLRLDANGGLNYLEASQWLQICSREPRIEFIEQPLPIEEIVATIELSQLYPTPIALDESIATWDKLQAVYRQGWRGIYVIKPGIAGFPWRLSNFIAEHQLDVVFSSVLETRIGRTAVLKLASQLNLQRALGFGVEEWFDDDL